MLEVPELSITEDEAQSLSSGIQRVSSHYDVSASSKQLAWANLIIVCSGIYGTRAFAYQQRRKNEKASGPRTLHAVPEPAKPNGKAAPEPAQREQVRPLNPSDLWMQGDPSEQ